VKRGCAAGDGMVESDDLLVHDVAAAEPARPI
jgi:hypothetical protein